MRSWEERLRLILALIEKDLRIPVWIWIVTIVVASVGFFMLLPAALSAARFSPSSWTWNDFNLRPYYAMSVFLSSLILGLIFASFHGGEIRRGTIRSIILYPVDMNDITIAKLVSSFIITAVLSTAIFLGLFGSFFLVGFFPFADFLAIHATALVMSFVALGVGVFLAQWLAQLAGRMVISPAALGALFLLFAILLTETALTQIGLQMAYLSAETQGRQLTIEDIRRIQSTAQAISVLSPVHAGGRMLALAFGVTRLWVDLHVIVPIAALVGVAGYAFGKKLYLDVFIR